jgi:hypothetical protein
VTGIRAGFHGYAYIGIEGHNHLAHRLAWLYVHGEWPTEIDHIDRNRMNNAISNLRSVSKAENRHNVPTLKGYQQRGRRYWARITAFGERRSLGVFDTPEAATEAYRRAKLELHPTSPLNAGKEQGRTDPACEGCRWRAPA